MIKYVVLGRSPGSDSSSYPPSRKIQWLMGKTPPYSGGTAEDLDFIPYSPFRAPKTSLIEYSIHDLEMDDNK